MERETATTKIGEHEFTHYTYATAREMSNIQKTLFAGSKVALVGNEPKIDDFDFEAQFNVKLEMIRHLVVEMDGSKSDIVKRCEQLPDTIFQELTAHLDATIAKKN